MVAAASKFLARKNSRETWVPNKNKLLVIIFFVIYLIRDHIFRGFRMKETEDTLSISFAFKRGKGIIRLVEFEDNGHFIVYVPSLNLSAYGNNYDEALQMMSDIVIEDFFDNLLDQPENVIYNHLRILGWQQSQDGSGELSNQVHIDTEGILKNFNLPADTKIKERSLEL